MNENILVVGGCGYVGGYLVDTLKRNFSNSKITVYDSLLYESRYLKNVDFIYGDVRDKKKLEKILPQYDTVIWLAALVGDGACAIDPKLTYEINTESVKWLVDHFEGKLVFFSTASIYGINHGLLTEETEPNPISVYAASKLEAEQYVIENHENHLVFRLGTLFGIGDEISRIRLDLVVNVLTKRAVLKEPLKVFGGEQWRPLLHVKDVAYAVSFGLSNDSKGLYNLSNENYMIKDMAAEVQNVISECAVDYVDMKFEDLRNYKIDGSKYKKLGWQPLLSLKHGIEEIKTVILENRLVDITDPVYSNVQHLNKIFKEATDE